MKRIAFLITVFVLLGVASSALARIPEPPKKEEPVAVVSRDGQTPYIEYVKGSFGGPWWNDGWLWVYPGQSFRISWKAGDVRWCNRWSLDPNFKGPSRARGEYWARLYKPNPNSAHGGWVFGLTCGNGVAPNTVARIWVKVRTTPPKEVRKG